MVTKPSHILSFFVLSVPLFSCFVLFLDGLLADSSTTIDLSSIIWWTPRLFPHLDTEHIPGTVPARTEDYVTSTSYPGKRCYTTVNRDKVHQITAPIAFVFYGTDTEVEDLPLPRLASHRWALLHEESPMNNYVLSHRPMIELFNYTATFRRQSDYPLTTLFVPNLAYLTDRRPVPLHVKNEFRRTGTAPVLYIQSHCDVAADRDRYVLELANHVRIDSYGRCLNNRSLPDELSGTETFDSEPFLTFVARYKFHLAFENAVCEDYVTEKLFRALHVGSVPVYRGSPTVVDWDPNFRSVIRVDVFESPRQLADLINRLDADDEAYQTYLDFKETGGITNELLLSNLADRDWSNVDYDKDNFIQGYERFVCDRLLEHEAVLASGSSVNVSMASMDHVGCPEPSPSIGTLEDMSSSEKNNLMEWIDNYRYSDALARAVSRMVRTNSTDSSQVHNIAYLHSRDEL